MALMSSPVVNCLHKFTFLLIQPLRQRCSWTQWQEKGQRTELNVDLTAPYRWERYLNLGQFRSFKTFVYAHKTSAIMSMYNLLQHSYITFSFLRLSFSLANLIYVFAVIVPFALPTLMFRICFVSADYVSL